MAWEWYTDEIMIGGEVSKGVVLQLTSTEFAKLTADASTSFRAFLDYSNVTDSEGKLHHDTNEEAGSHDFQVKDSSFYINQYIEVSGSEKTAGRLKLFNSQYTYGDVGVSVIQGHSFLIMGGFVVNEDLEEMNYVLFTDVPYYTNHYEQYIWTSNTNSTKRHEIYLAIKGAKPAPTSASTLYIGDPNGICRNVPKLYYGDPNGIARKCKLFYGDPNGIARLIIGEGQSPYPIPLTEFEIEVLKGAYNIDNQNLYEDIIWYTDTDRYGSYDFHQTYKNLSSIVQVREGQDSSGSWVVNDRTEGYRYFINSQDFTVKLYSDNFNEDLSDVNFTDTYYEGRMGYAKIPYAQSSAEISEYGFCIARTRTITAGSYIYGKFIYNQDWFWNLRTGSGGVVYYPERNLANALLSLWGSKNIPIYYGSSPSTAVLLPDPSTL